MVNIRNPFNNKYVLILLCFVIVVGCITTLTGGSAFVGEHSLAILVVLFLTIALLDLIT